jgi:NAD(P)-dependent dehydrogenase (short-subunit alcohol dehydrogenase family)
MVDKTVIIAADLSDPVAPERVAEEAVAKLGHVDILINNASIGSSYIRKDFVTSHVRFWEHTPEHTRRFFQINSISPYVLAKPLVRETSHHVLKHDNSSCAPTRCSFRTSYN